MIIAVDGPAASGKGTLSKRIAEHYGLNHLDTGLLYRAVARSLLDRGIALTDEAAATEAARGLDFHQLDETRLRGADAGEAASVISVYAGVRAALLDGQRSFAAQTPGAVLDGRDIGTVICPKADAKIFVTASPEERAKRRWLELKTTNPELAYDTVLAENLKVMDASAVALCRDNNIPIVVFSIRERGNLARVLVGEGTQTTVTSSVLQKA